jgi:SAM-dependent methyltransferase
MPTLAAARGIIRGDLNLAVCATCGFIFNATFELGKLSYNESYDNTQSCSAVFRDYLDDLAHHLVNERGVRGQRIVEVGCGKGLFLRQLVEADGNNQGYGFDPTYEGPLDNMQGRLQFQRTFYGLECADVPADVVVCRHVIEHVPDPIGLLRMIRGGLIHSPHARLFFETPDVTWILSRRVIWDFFYEHCSYFTPHSLQTAFEIAGFSVSSVKRVFGEQYLWLESALATMPMPAMRQPDEIVSLAEAFLRDETKINTLWCQQLKGLAQHGPVALWGAGAKGVTLANLLDTGCELIDCIVDVNPAKQGRFLPGTGHPIISPGDMINRGIRSAILMNPNYREEIQQLLHEIGAAVELVELEETEAE